MPETEVLETPSVVAETIIPTETPAAPDGAAPSAPADEAAITEPAASLSAKPRGPDGRFIKADGTQASEAEHAAIEAAAPASPPIATTPTPPAPPAAPTGQPFVVRGDGQRIAMPGSTTNDQGDLTVLAEHVPAYRQLIAEGLAYRGSWRTEKADYQKQITEAGAVQEARAQKYNGASVFMLETIESPEWQAEFKESPERALYYLKREVGFMLKEADLKAPQPRATPTQDPAVEQEQLRTSATATVTDYVEELLESPLAKALYPKPEDRTAAIARYARHVASYAVEVDGQIAIDTHAVRADWDDELQLRQAGQKAAGEAQKAAEFNARRNAPAVAAPPVVSPKGPGSTGAANRPQFKTRDEYNKAMGIN